MYISTKYLHVFLDIGDALLSSGAEIFRVEDTLNRGICMRCNTDECVRDHIKYCYYNGISRRKCTNSDKENPKDRRK